MRPALIQQLLTNGEKKKDAIMSLLMTKWGGGSSIPAILALFRLDQADLLGHLMYVPMGDVYEQRTSHVLVF